MNELSGSFNRIARPYNDSAMRRNDVVTSFNAVGTFPNRMGAAFNGSFSRGNPSDERFY